MYKNASQTLQRRATRIVEVRPDASAYVSDDDLIQSAANLGKAECEAERRDLLTEKTRRENELVVAKRARDRQEVARIGHRIQSICSRLAMLRDRLHEIERAGEHQTFRTAVREIVPAEMLKRIYDRQAELKGAL